MLVRDFLRKAPVTVPPECTLEEAANLMGAHGVGSLVVVSGGELVGILTDRDVTVRGVGAGRPSTSPVSTVMTDRPVTVEGSEDIIEAYRLLKENAVRRLPVLEDGELAGVITLDDLLVTLVLELGALLSPVAGEIVHPDAT